MRHLTLVLIVLVTLVAPAALAAVIPGIEVLVKSGFAPLKGKRVGLITNHSGTDRKGRHIVDLLYGRSDFKLVALFCPEHGIRGGVDSSVKDSVDKKTGLPVYSLYGVRYRPTDKLLEGIDVLVFDIQDIGARFYTYPCTMKLCMREAAKHRISFVVLDRPNPINGRDIDGPIMDTAYMGFASWAEVPTRHGMTMGELALYFNDHFKYNCDLTVIKAKGWRRNMWFDQTKLPWVNPSPNIRNVTEEALYPGIGCLEATNLSVGRGTDTPFEVFGAPWVDAEYLVKELNARKLPGLRFKVTEFVPQFRELKGEHCRGARVIVTDRDAIKPVEAAVHIAEILHARHGTRFVMKGMRGMIGKGSVVESLAKEEPAKKIISEWKKEMEGFAKLRRKYLLYE